MILEPRKHLYATNIIFFCLIFVLQKLITIFCIIERKTCSNVDCLSPPQTCRSAQCHNNNSNNNNNYNRSRNNGSKKLTTHAPPPPMAGSGGYFWEDDDADDEPCRRQRRSADAVGGGGGGCGVGGAGSGSIMPAALRKTMRMFGYGEGHYQIFVEEKQRMHPSKACLNAAVAELKLNPN